MASTKDHETRPDGHTAAVIHREVTLLLAAAVMSHLNATKRGLSKTDLKAGVGGRKKKLTADLALSLRKKSIKADFLKWYRMLCTSKN